MRDESLSRIRCLSTPDYAEHRRWSSWRIQLISGFQLVPVRSTILTLARVSAVAWATARRARRRLSRRSRVSGGGGLPHSRSALTRVNNRLGWFAAPVSPRAPEARDA